MKCSVCKKIIPKNTLKCPYCKAITGILCKNCNAINSPVASTCTNCGQTLQNELRNDKQLQTYTPNQFSQQKAIKILSEILLQKSQKIISIFGDTGCGKNYILKESIMHLQNQSYVWLFGKCTQFTQMTAGGVMQDILLNLFNLPNFCPDINTFKTNSLNFFQQEFPDLNKSDIEILTSFLYPHQYGNFDNLLKNKNEIFNVLYKIFNKITQISDCIIIIDNLDLIDEFSKDFINTLLQNSQILPKTYIITLSSVIKPIAEYFNFSDTICCFDMTITKFEVQELDEFYQKFQEAFSYANESETQEIIDKSNGNPAFLEQAVSFCFDCQLGDITFKLPNSLAELIEVRLLTLKKNNPAAHKILMGATILGDKINLTLLKTVFKLDDKSLNDIIEYLIKMQFITPVNEIFLEFKSLLLWETILRIFKTDTDFLNLNRIISKTLDELTFNSNAIKVTLAQNLWQANKSLTIWKENAKYAAFIGDISFCIASHKQCLALLNELDGEENVKTKSEIFEQLGKILSDYKPEEAIEILTKIISDPKIANNDTKQIELLSYISYCCTKTRNYYGNLECINKVLEKVPQENKLQIALLKAIKIPSLLTLGNCGEIINLAENEIIPTFDKFLHRPYATNLSYAFIWNIWLKTYLYLANALVLQGNGKAFEILTIVFDIIEKNKIKDINIICQSKLILALANTVKGEVYPSEIILNDIATILEPDNINDSILLQLNIVRIFNKFLKGQYGNLQNELSKAISLANKINNPYVANILQTLSGKVFEHNNDTSRAQEIYNEQISYFAKEKTGLGALLTWWLIADITLKTESPHAAIEIAEQALSVAQNPKINNHIFTILLKTVISKAMTTITDYETSKINLENAITIATQFDLQDILARLYLLYGKYYQEIGLTQTDKQTEYLTHASKMYKKALNIAQTIKNNSITTAVQNTTNELNEFCRLNNIKLKA